MSKNKALNWAEECGKSNGTMFMVPAEMKDKADEFAKRSEEYKEKVKIFNKLVAEFDHYGKNFWHEMRSALEAEAEDVWSKNIGFNKRASDEGFKVVNIVVNNQQPMQM